MATCKKRKVDAEGRTFKDSWTRDFFVIFKDGRILCLICEGTIAVCKEYNVKRHYNTMHASKFDSLVGQLRIDRVNLLKQNAVVQQTSDFEAVDNSPDAATKISFLIAEAIAKRGKPLSDGEFVKDCLGLFTSVACPDKLPLVEEIDLSSQTLFRRIDDLASNIENLLIERLEACQLYSLGLVECKSMGDKTQLAIFVRGVTKCFHILEEFLDLCQMEGTATGQDIFLEVERVLLKFNLPVNKLCGLSTDGSPVMTAEHNGLVSLMHKSLPQAIFTHHCFVLPEMLCERSMGMQHVMGKVLSTAVFTWLKGREHKEFQIFLTEMGSDRNNLSVFNQNHWLRRAATLAIFWTRMEEIRMFMTSRGKDASFMDDVEWLNDLAFLVDIAKFLADLNVKLQLKGQLVHKFYEHVQEFIQKLDMIQEQVIKRNVVHLPTLSTRCAETVKYEKYSTLIASLREEFKQQYSFFREYSDELKLFADPFNIDASDAPDVFQLELIDIQNNGDMKRAFAEHDRLTVYAEFVPSEYFPNLSAHALKCSALFGSTHCCDQFFSRIKIFNTKHSLLLTGGHLSAMGRVATSNIQAEIDYLCKEAQ